MVNWKMRIRSRRFWLALISAVLLLVQSAAALFGLRLELGTLSQKLLAIVNAVFMLLTALGVPNAAGERTKESAGGEEGEKKCCRCSAGSGSQTH